MRKVGEAPDTAAIRRCKTMCVCVYLSCYIAGFDLLDDRSIDDVVYSIFGDTCLVQQTPKQTQIDNINRTNSLNQLHST